MGWWQAVSAAMRLGRENRRGQLGATGLLGVAVGATLTWLAGRRSAVPPVRATGVTANGVYPAGRPPRDRAPLS